MIQLIPLVIRSTGLITSNSSSIWSGSNNSFQHRQLDRLYWGLKANMDCLILAFLSIGATTATKNHRTWFQFGVSLGLDLDVLHWCYIYIYIYIYFFFFFLSCKPNRGWERISKFCVCFGFKEILCDFLGKIRNFFLIYCNGSWLWKRFVGKKKIQMLVFVFNCSYGKILLIPENFLCRWTLI